MLPTICNNFRWIAQKLRTAQNFYSTKVLLTFNIFKDFFVLFRFILKQICLFWLSLYTFLVCFSSFWNKSVRFSCFNVQFWFVLVHFETKQFVSVVAKFIWNTETNRNKIIIGFENEPKQTQNRSCFGYFRFEPKFFCFCFVDTLIWRSGYFTFSGHEMLLME